MVVCFKLMHMHEGAAALGLGDLVQYGSNKNPQSKLELKGNKPLNFQPKSEQERQEVYQEMTCCFHYFCLNFTDSES